MTVKVVSNFLAKKTSSKTSFTKHQVYLTITESHVKQSKGIYIITTTHLITKLQSLQQPDSYQQLHTICPKIWNMKQSREVSFINAEQAIHQRLSKPCLGIN